MTEKKRGDEEMAASLVTHTEVTHAQETYLKREDFSHLYTMFYRHGMNANLTKGFYFEGDLLQARARAEAHCNIMGYKFIFLRPMVCDLEHEEAYKLKGAREGELMP